MVYIYCHINTLMNYQKTAEPIDGEITKVTETHSRQYGLDLIRALAIVLVLLSHFVKKLSGLGFWGVELFFVLSGFLIGGILWNSFMKSSDWSVKYLTNFWSRRWWRTLPNYYLFFIVSFIFFYYNEGKLPDTSIVIRSLWFVQNLLSRNDGFYGVSWSLCIEEFFYILFPLTLFFISKVTSKNKSFALTLFIFIIGPLLVRLLLASNGVSGIRGITLARLDAINYGVLIRVLYSYYKDFTLKYKTHMLGCAIALFIVYQLYSVFTHVSQKELTNNVFALTVSPIIVSLILPYMSTMKPILFLRGIVEKLSLWSYSIYLSHISILFTIYAAFGTTRASVSVNLLSKIVGVLVTVVISGFIYNYFEVPIMHKRPKDISRG